MWVASRGQVRISYSKDLTYILYEKLYEELRQIHINN